MISTKDVQATSSSPKKTLSPGEHTVKINSIALESVSYKAGAYHLVLNVEGPNMGPEFEGFLVDKDKPNGARYKGQIGKVKFGFYPFSDGETKTGIKISRDLSILRAIQQLCIASNKLEWFEEADGKFATIEEFVKGANTVISDGSLFKMCINGKEYEKNGYINYDLFLPKSSKDAYAMESASASPSKLIAYNPELHIKKAKVEVVESFGDSNPFKTDSDTSTGFDF
jgi:hypothetical protein